MSEAAPPATRARGTRRGFGVVIAAHSADGFATFLLPPYLASIDLSVNVIGLIIAAGGLAALATRLPAGLLYRPTRARWLQVAALLLGMVAVFLLPVTREALLLAGLRALGGLAHGVATTTNLARFLDAIPPGRDRATAIGYYSGAVAMGYFISASLAGFVVDGLGYGVGFALAAASCLAGVAFALGMPAPRPSARPPAASRAGSPLATVRALAEPGLLRVALAAFLMAFIQLINVTFFPLYALGVGLTLSEIGIVRAATASTNVVARGIGGIITRYLGRGPVQHVGLVTQGFTIALLPTMGAFWPILALMLVASLARAAVLVANTIALAEDVDESRVSRGAAAGVFSAATDLGGVVAPAVAGALAATIGVDRMLQTLLPLCVGVYLLAMLATRRPRKRSAT